uniref:Uncharacterized protein n=1 Tax=Rhizophora mucronata TaxID=61149 RepID=A0A2P2PJU9_RHIMU
MIQSRSPDPVRRSIPIFPGARTQSRAHLRKQRSLSTLERNNFKTSAWRPMAHDKMSLHEGSSVLDLRSENYFSCAVSKKRSTARYSLGSPDDVVSLIKELAEAL